MNSNSKSVNIHELKPSQPEAGRLVNIMTILAWLALAIGVVMCVANISEFNDRNWGLMVGIGFLVGSVHIYVIGTAIGLVHKRAMNQAAKKLNNTN